MEVGCYSNELLEMEGCSKRVKMLDLEIGPKVSSLDHVTWLAKEYYTSDLFSVAYL